MRLECHDHLHRPVILQATRVLVLDDFGNPVSFTVQVQPGHVATFHVGDADFQEQLRMHGVDKTVLVRRLEV